MTTLPEHLQARLRETGKKPKHASLSAGLNETYARDIIDGAKPQYDKLRRLAGALDTTAEALWFGPESEEAKAAELGQTYLKLGPEMRKRLADLVDEIVRIALPPEQPGSPGDRSDLAAVGAGEKFSDTRKRRVAVLPARAPSKPQPKARQSAGAGDACRKLAGHNRSMQMGFIPLFLLT